MSRSAPKLLLAGVAFFAAVAIPILIGRGIDMDRTSVEIVQGVLALVGTFLVYRIGHERPGDGDDREEPPPAERTRKSARDKAAGQATWGKRRERWVILVVVALLSAASFVRFGHFHYPRFLHNWDLYHYFLGARYFEELGYYDLYRCTVEADEELGGQMSDARRVRDLHTLGYTSRARLLRQEPPCRDAFTAPRWESFKRDLQFFETITPRHLWRSILQDKGYNGTPAWTWYVGLLTEWSGTDEVRLDAICALDEVLLVLALLAVLWAFGPRVFLLATIFVGINFATRFQHLGGSLLRLDWLASLVLALCCLKKERWTLAGVLVAHATAARLFPLLFLTGIGFRALWIVITERRLERRYLRLGGGLAAGLVVFGLLGAAGARGPQAWREFAENIVPHASAPATKRIGLKYLILPIGGEAQPDRARGQTANEAVRERWSRRQPLAFVIAGGALFLLFVGARRRVDFEAFALGVIPVFFLLAPTRYYWAMLCIPVVVWAGMRHRWQVEALVLMMTMQVLLYALSTAHRLGLTSEPIENVTLSNIASWCLLVIFGHVLWSISRDDLTRWWRTKKTDRKEREIGEEPESENEADPKPARRNSGSGSS